MKITLNLDTDCEAAQQAKRLDVQERALFRRELDGDEEAETERQELWKEIRAHQDTTGWGYSSACFTHTGGKAMVRVLDLDAPNEDEDQ